MKTYLWYSNGTSVTGRALAQELGLTRMSPTSSDRQYGTLPPPIGTTHCIVYGAKIGNWKMANYRWKRNIKWLNNPHHVDIHQDKFVALEQMDYYDVSTPLHYTSKSLAKADFGFPMVGRKFRHQGGSGFDFIIDETSLSNSDSDYFMEYIDGDDKREYRIHVFGGRVIKVQRKKEQDEGATDYVCRSHTNGWYFSNCDINRIHASILSNAIKAVSALGYSFGAVDIIRVPSTNTTKVLEVNSGMGLDNSGLSLYKEVMQGWLDEI